MKKALLILVSLMLVVSLAACAPADNGDDAVAPEVKATATADDAGKTAADLLGAVMQDAISIMILLTAFMTMLAALQTVKKTLGFSITMMLFPLSALLM